MLLFIWLMPLTLVSAFYPLYPSYKCIQDGKCLATVTERDVNGDGFGKVIQELPTFKIKQRAPTDDLPHHIKIKRYLERLAKKFEPRGVSVEKRSNGYPIATAVAPSQANSVGLSQDGTDFSYFAQVKFGSNGTPLWMLMDTGASATWVMATTCKSPSCLSHNTYGPTNSKTYQTIAGNFDIAYGTGHVSGVLATDTVSFAGFSLSLTFGVANETSDDFLHFPFDGIMGLARDAGSYPTVLEALGSAKVTAASIFGVNIDRNLDGTHDGEINFGAPDSSKYSGSLNYTPLSSSNGDWVIPVDGVGVDSKSAGITGRSAYIDTGTSYIFIPPADAKALHGLIAGSQLSSDGHSWYVPCTTTSPIQFSFSGITYNVLPKDWIGGKTGGTLCTSNIYPATPVGQNNWLLGDTFMKNVYTVFDSGQKRIGFGAKANPSPASQAASTSASSASPSSSSSTPSSTSGPLTSNIMSTGPVATSSASGPMSVTPGNSGSSGFNAAITSAVLSAAPSPTSSSSPASTTAAQGSAGTRLETFVSTLFAVLISAIVVIIT